MTYVYFVYVVGLVINLEYQNCLYNKQFLTSYIQIHINMMIYQDSKLDKANLFDS